MPQMNKGGKFIFGKSLIRTDGTLRIPPQAMEEYHIADEGKVYLFTGSKITGGFCVTRKGLLHPSKLGHILDDTPPLLDYSDLPCMELLDDELGHYMDCMAGCRCFVCSIAWCGENGVKEWQ